jgi:hypothetical protein
VVTANFAYDYIDNVPDQPYEISFDWTEIGIGEEGIG